MSKRSIFVSALFALVLLASPASARTTVRVDHSFGSDGTVAGKLGPRYRPTSFISVAPQADGSLLASRVDESEPTALLRRYGPDGSLDPSFEPRQVTPRLEAVEADGKVLKAKGQILERFNPDGSSDITFHSERVGFEIERIEPLFSGEILVGGGIVVTVPEAKESPGGTFVEQEAVARLDAEGRVEAGFGHSGIAELGSVAPGTKLAALAPRPGGGVAAVVVRFPQTTVFEIPKPPVSTLAALTPGGSPDSSFAQGGAVHFDGKVEALNVLEDGSMLVAGDRWGPWLGSNAGYESDVFINRYEPGGKLDQGFGGGDGSVTLDLEGLTVVHTVLWESDGSTLLGGATTAVGAPSCKRFFRFCRETPFLARFMPDGSRDIGFGDGGALRLTSLSASYVPGGGGAGVLALASRPGGGYVAAGGAGISAFIAALTPGGALDPSFGESGIVREDIPTSSSSAGRAMTTDSHGRILVAGGTNAGVPGFSPVGAVFRYLPNGELDHSFGGGSGFVRVPGDAGGIVVLPDDSCFVLSGSPSAVTRITAAGQVDASYGEEGVAPMPGPFDVYRHGRRHRLFLDGVSMVPLPGGRLLVAGTAGSNEPRVFVVRLRADGSLDPSFGRRGVDLLGFGRSHRAVVSQMTVDRHGRIVLAGYVKGRPNEERSEKLALMRLRSNGARDPGFGRRGLVVTRIGRRSLASALAIQRNGRIVVAGRSQSGRRAKELLLGYQPDGRLDPSFGRGGIASASVPVQAGGFFARVHQILLRSHRILLLRDSRYRQLVAYSGDGRHRRSFVVARAAEPGNRAIQAPFGALQDGKLVLGWEVFDPPVSSFKLQRLQIEDGPKP
jgi:uncharacterized delta-60 repeat protein